MGIKERRERERLDTREKILDAARDLFISEGYDAVTMRQIAQRIEYSPTAIYFHFPDTESLFRELCAMDFLALGEMMREIATIADPLERLRRTGQAYVGFALEHPNHYRLMFMTPHPVEPSEVDGVDRGNPDKDAYAFLKATLAECIARGLFRPELQDVELLAQTLWASVHGVVSLHIAKGRDGWIHWRPVKQRFDTIFDALLRGIRREGPVPVKPEPESREKPPRK